MCSAGGHGLHVQGGGGKEGLCLCLLLPYPVCSPALYLAVSVGDVAEQAPSSPAHQGREVFAALTYRTYIVIAVEIYKWGFASGCVYFCVEEWFLPGVSGFSRGLCDQEFCSFFVLNHGPELWSSFGL